MYGFINIFYPFNLLFFLSSPQVPIREGVTIQDALRKAMKTRNLTPNSCVVYAESPRSLIEWNTDTTQLSGKEVCLSVSLPFCLFLFVCLFVSVMSWFLFSSFSLPFSSFFSFSFNSFSFCRFLLSIRRILSWHQPIIITL